MAHHIQTRKDDLFFELLRYINWNLVTAISAVTVAFFAYKLQRDITKPQIGVFSDNDDEGLFKIKNHGILPAHDVKVAFCQIEAGSPNWREFRTIGDMIFKDEEIGSRPDVFPITTYTQYLLCLWSHKHSGENILRKRIFRRSPNLSRWTTGDSILFSGGVLTLVLAFIPK